MQLEIPGHCKTQVNQAIYKNIQYCTLEMPVEPSQ